MFFPTNKIQWMDVASGKVYTDEIRTFFRSYIHLATYYQTDPRGRYRTKIDFKDRIVKITDMFGWTDVLSVKCVSPYVTSSWIRLICANKIIIVSADTKMITYEPTKMSRGFHGEVKYGTEIKKASELQVDKDILRVKRGGVDENFNDVEFSSISSQESFRNYKRLHFGYVFKTRSTTLNIADVHCIDNII
jgi:hypothetical protein